eukprot:c28444_g1_i1 orf=707-3676(+)
MSSQGGWGSSKEFLDLVKAIGEAKSKAEEERIVTEEIEMLKKRIAEPDVPRKKMKEYIIRLLYVEMLGHDASFGYIHAVKMTHDDNLLLKRTGYLAVTLFLNEEHDLIILIINTIQKDLRSDNYLICCAALTAVCRLINEETIPAVLPQVVELLGHQKEHVRKKAVMALHRFYQRSPATVSHLVPKFRQRLCDNDPSVMSASLCALFDLISADAHSYKNLTASFVSILKQVVEHRLPKLYDYHRTPAPFIQIKLLKNLALLGAGDKKTSENMYSVLGDVLKRAEPNGNIGNAILYECICTITSIYPNTKLLEAAADITSRFLKNENHNLKYMGIDALGRVIKINPEFAEGHQLAVIDCLEDPDDTLKRKTLDLLYKMTKSTNVEVIVERMISYMKTVNDSHYKTEIASNCIELAERFAPSNQWFIQTMNQVFEHVGDLVSPKVAHDLMRLIAEGSGEEDEDADSQLRCSAVESYLHILGEPKLPSILLQVICWVLGEYGTADGTYSAAYIIGKLCDVAEAHPSDTVVKGYAITAITKICAFEIAAGRRAEIIPECQGFMDELSASHSTDLQQRAYELQAILGLTAADVSSIMPMDASCEDIEVDINLSFLNGFVQSSLSKGARHYMTEDVRIQSGAIGSLSSQRDHGDSSHGLKFDPYEKPKPLPASVAPSSSISSFVPEFDDYRSAQSSYKAAYAVHYPPEVDLNPDTARLRLDGVQKKWGRQTYSASTPPVSREKPTNSHTSSDTGRLDGNTWESSYEPQFVDKNKHVLEVSPEKQKLAASLFGGASSKADVSGRGATKANKPPLQKGHSTTSAQSNIDKKNEIAQDVQGQTFSRSKPSPPDLLDLSEEVPPVLLPRDPFKELEGLLEVPAALVPPSVGITDKKETIDLMSLYEAANPASSHEASISSANSVVDMTLRGETVKSGITDLTAINRLSSDSLGSTAKTSLLLAKKGPSPEGALQRDAISRQVGVTPTGPNPDLFHDLLG